MLPKTIEYLKATPLTRPVPKTHDPRDGYWLVRCIVTEVSDTQVTFRYTNGVWLDETLSFPLPHRLATVYECMHLSVMETITRKRIEYLCSVG